MIVLESNNLEESKIGWFAYVPKNRVNSENWKLVCEHLNNLEISKQDTMYLPLIGISQISVSNGPHLPRNWLYFPSGRSSFESLHKINELYNQRKVPIPRLLVPIFKRAIMIVHRQISVSNGLDFVKGGPEPSNFEDLCLVNVSVQYFSKLCFGNIKIQPELKYLKTILEVFTS